MAAPSPIKSGPVVLLGPRGARPGNLTLTAQDLVFDGPVPRGPPMMGRPGPGGRFGGRPGFGPRGPGAMEDGELRIPLWRCRQASSVPGPQGAALQLELLSRTLVLSTNDAAGWAAAINQARANAPPPPHGAMAGGAGGAPPVTPMRRCDYCARLSPANVPKCENCGAPF
jgi:hypothetical protein